MESSIASVHVTKNCKRTIAALKDIGYKIGIISNSYTIAVGFVADILNLDLVMAKFAQDI